MTKRLILMTKLSQDEIELILPNASVKPLNLFTGI